MLPSKINAFLEDLVVNEFCLSEEKHRVLINTIERYSKRETFDEKIHWLAYRVQNGVRYLFKDSDWQKTLQMIVDDQQNKFFAGLSDDQKALYGHLYSKNCVLGGSDLVLRLFLQLHERKVTNEDQMNAVEIEMDFEQKITIYRIELEFIRSMLYQKIRG